MKKDLLLVFVKNPVAGKVKTRLAKTIGNEEALKVYEQLLRKTEEVTQNVSFDVRVCYSDSIGIKGFFESEDIQKELQTGSDLGERMSHAFEKAFNDGYNKVAIIGSDCYALNTVLLEETFVGLVNSEVVIGPAMDGGYYLLGMKNYYPQIFKNVEWSTEKVFETTTKVLDDHELSYVCLPVLSDVDTEEDLGELNYII